MLGSLHYTPSNVKHVHAFTFTAFEGSIVTGLFMGEIFHFQFKLKVQIKSRIRSDYVIDRKSMT